jgi:hypothetical protein
VNSHAQYVAAVQPVRRRQFRKTGRDGSIQGLQRRKGAVNQVLSEDIAKDHRSAQSLFVLVRVCRDGKRAAGEVRARLRFGLGRPPLVVCVAGETDLVERVSGG